MVGGDAAAFERARPVLDLLGTRVWHCGAAGTGHAMKTALNLADADQADARDRIAALGVKAGLDAHQVAEVLELGMWQHFLLGPDGRIPFQFVLALVGKDFDVAMRLAAERGVPMPVDGAAVQAMRAVRATVGGDADLMECRRRRRTLESTYGSTETRGNEHEGRIPRRRRRRARHRARRPVGALHRTGVPRPCAAAPEPRVQRRDRRREHQHAGPMGSRGDAGAARAAATSASRPHSPRSTPRRRRAASTASRSLPTWTSKASTSGSCTRRSASS